MKKHIVPTPNTLLLYNETYPANVNNSAHDYSTAMVT